MKKNLLFFLYILFGIGILSAQEALLSDAERYYDFLALQGQAKRPYLNYRTLSDSVWDIDNYEGTLWQEQNLGTKQKIFADFFMRVYGPEVFASYNTAAPYGQNDGALWQGKGLNSSLSGGIRFEGYGFEFTYKPQVVFSQNKAFDLMHSDYDSEYGYIWGDNHKTSGNIGVDAPQRFGDDSFYDYSWGDSEIRYTWKTVTLGFGTQNIWLGSGRVNSILHSNNAPPYPKLDFGIRRQEVTIPWIDWYAGDIEARIWGGYLTESDYFDNDDANNHNLIAGLALAYAPSFLPGLTVYANRTFLSEWGKNNFSYFAQLFLDTKIQEKEDQKISLGLNYFLPQAAIEVYGEVGLNDYFNQIRYPLSTMVYLTGLRKGVDFFSDTLKGELVFEWSSFEISQDYQFFWPQTFYGHHLIKQGYTNRGQWLGAGIGTGGNSQYLGFKVYHKNGYVVAYLYRVNPDNDFIYKNGINTTLPTLPSGSVQDGYRFKASLSFGIQQSYFVTEDLSIGCGFVYQKIVNPEYEAYMDSSGKHSDMNKNNYIFLFGFQFYI